MSDPVVSFDPDFDETPVAQGAVIERREGWNAMNPRQAFAAGFVAAVLVVGTLGCIALLAFLV